MPGKSVHLTRAYILRHIWWIRHSLLSTCFFADSMAFTTPNARFAESEKVDVSEVEKASTGLALTESQRSTGYAVSTAGLDHKHETSKAERKLVFKLDILILPLAMLLYLSAYLDRGNLGNAKLMGLTRDVLGGDSTKFSLALSSFFSQSATILAK